MSSVSRRSTVVSPVAASIRMTDSGVVGPPATPTIVLPSADRPEVNSWKPMSGSVISAVSGSSSPRCMLPTPCRTASLPSPSTANGRPPSCHSGSANSSSAGNSAWAGSPSHPAADPAHHPRPPHPAFDNPPLGGEVAGKHGDPQLGAVPRHPRVIPADPGQAAAVRRGGREREEVRPSDEFADGLRVSGSGSVQRDGDDGAGDLAVVVPLLDTPDLSAVRGQREVGVTQRSVPVMPRRLRGERARVGVHQGRLAFAPAGALLLDLVLRNDVESLVSVVRKDNRSATGRLALPATPLGQRQVGKPAVFVHAGAGVPGGGEHAALLPPRAAVHHGDPAAFIRPAFLPPHVVTDDNGVRDQHLPLRHIYRGDRGRPTAIGDCGRSRALCHRNIVYHARGRPRKIPDMPLAARTLVYRHERLSHLPDPHPRVPDEHA